MRVLSFEVVHMHSSEQQLNETLQESNYPANRKRFDNITVWLYKGLAKPNVGKMLLKRFEMVVNWQCKYQPLANVMKTFF